MAEKIKVAELEKIAQGGQIVPRWAEFVALLRVLRAAKSVTDNLEPHSPVFANHDCAVCDLRAALDAFDFS